MGEHTLNRQALLAKTLPTFPPANHQLGIIFSCAVVPKVNVLLAMPGEPLDESRFPEGKLPEGLKVHVAGTPLPPKDCDVAIGLGCRYEEIHMVAARGGPHVGVFPLPVELGRVDYQEFLEACERSLPRLGLVG